MRRMWAAGEAIVVCLALVGLSGLAQGAEQGAVKVTGAQDCAFSSGRCTFTASDPRVAGAGTVSALNPVYNSEGIPILTWDEVRLEGPDGTWSGHHYVVAGEAGTVYVFMVLSGDGPYKGWHYVAAGTDSVPHGEHDLIGVLYEGPLPPIGPGVSSDLLEPAE
jgi:hypothetical protein